MSTSSRSPLRGFLAPAAGFAGEGGNPSAQAGDFGDARAHDASGGGRGPRKKRRRQRTQRNKRRGGSDRGAHLDLVSRESMFQDVEGLLRQIRERAEETAEWTEAELGDFTQAVTGFMKSLEEESEQVSERARSDYQRVREKLAQALRG
jgi:hypothetical protein